MRMLLGCVLVIVATAATVTTGVLLEVKSFTDALKLSPQLKLGNELATANAGGAQTILLIGSDKRAKGAIDSSSPPHSDTMLLVRLDPGQPDTTMLSIPRDLKVTIDPFHAAPITEKINASYSLGGPRLTVKTIKRLLGIQINHVVDINFLGFKALVNYLGCVYVQVDRHYLNTNAGLAPGQTYAPINIEAGYQKLCGQQALNYVRFRHADTDLVRNARQQDFLRQIKSQLGASGLISKRVGLEKIFGRYASTDIRSSDSVLQLLELLVQSATHPIHQVIFQATLGPSYVTASRAQLHQTVHEFLNGGVANGHITLPAVSKHKHTRSVASVPLSGATSSELSQAHTLATNLPIPVYFPARRVTTAAAPPDDMRSYFLPDRMHHEHYAYVDVVAEGLLGQYYDLEGTDWTNPPMLANPNQTITLGGRKFELFFEGQRLRIVAWHQGPAVYWVINTLQNILTNHQMLAIAQDAQVVH
ncbi:MAG TPA: LCP family protein [Solirubrobacteraceae bacterium]|nr:LCP family protein [Solirubrobacteraceae bacterium]